ncbi:MAG: YdcF family protein [Arenicella sp.]
MCIRDRRIILTGGNVFEKIGISAESIYIRRKLIAMGIPKEAIIVESNSRTTRENATETEKILKKINAKSALLVTSAIHMPRSIQLFSVLSANVIPVPSDIIVTRDYAPTSLQLIPNVNAMALTTKALHEYYGIWTESINRLINGF